MQIKLSQAVTLQSTIKKTLAALKQERNQLAYLFVSKGDKYDLPSDRTFDNVNLEIENAENDLLVLEDKIAKANSSFTLEWDGRDISIIEALHLAKLYRNQADDYARFGSQQNNEIDRSRVLASTAVIRVLTYDPKEYAEKAKKLTRKANKLSDLIDDANVQNKISYPNYSIYMD